MPIIAQLMTMKAQTRCLQLETYLWLYFGILGEYAINIVDHAAEPMAGSIVTVRQLMQFVQTFMMQARVSQAQAQAQNQ